MRDLRGNGLQGLERRRRAQSDFQHRQTAFHQCAGERHGIGRPFDRQDGHHRRHGGDGSNVHDQMLQPPSTTLMVPVVKADSSLAR